MKLYVRDEIDAIDQEVKALLEALQKIMEENVHTYMPGFTHLQKAQPVTLAHHVVHTLRCSAVTEDVFLISEDE